jgi:hypothetical protein
MSVLGGDPDEIKTAAASQSTDAKILGNFLTAAALIAATAAAPVAPGLGVAAAVAHLWASIQDRIANDPIREDWHEFPPPIPERLRTRSYDSDLDDWAAALAEQAYCLGSALITAERLAGLDLAAEGFHSELGDVHRSLGRYFLTRADRLWPQVEPQGSGNPLLRAIMTSGVAPNDAPNEQIQVEDLQGWAEQMTRDVTERFDLVGERWRIFGISRADWITQMTALVQPAEPREPLFLETTYDAAVGRHPRFVRSTSWTVFGEIRRTRPDFFDGALFRVEDEPGP